MAAKDLNVFYFLSDTGNCPTGWEQFGGICYREGDTAEYWHDVETKCANLGGVPLHIHNAQELDFLGKWLQYSTSGNDYWTGGTHRHINDVGISSCCGACTVCYLFGTAVTIYW